MKASWLGRWILVALLFAELSPAFAFGERFVGSVTVNRRLRAVDSASETTLMTGFNTVSVNSLIEGTHFLLVDGSFRAAGGPWASVTQYVGYLRTSSEDGRCYQATFDAFFPPDVFEIWVSSVLCLHQHSAECGHCGPGTGNVCQQGVEEGRE